MIFLLTIAFCQRGQTKRTDLEGPEKPDGTEKADMQEKNGKKSPGHAPLPDRHTILKGATENLLTIGWKY